MSCSGSSRPPGLPVRPAPWSGPRPPPRTTVLGPPFRPTTLAPGASGGGPDSPPGPGPLVARRGLDPLLGWHTAGNTERVHRDSAGEAALIRGPGAGGRGRRRGFCAAAGTTAASSARRRPGFTCKAVSWLLAPHARWRRPGSPATGGP